MGVCSSVSVNDTAVIEDLVALPVVAEDTSEEIPHSLTCGVCFTLLATATTFTCGHTLCWKCAHRWVGDDKSKGCPECRKPVGDFRRCIALDHMARDIASKWPVDSERRIQWEESVREGLVIAVAYEAAQSQVSEHLPIRRLIRRPAFNESISLSFAESDTESSDSENESISVPPLILDEAALSVVMDSDTSSDDSSEGDTAEHQTDIEESEQDTEHSEVDIHDGDDGSGPWPVEPEVRPNSKVRIYLEVYPDNQMCEVASQPETELTMTAAATSAATIASLAANYAFTAATTAAVFSGAVTPSHTYCSSCSQCFKPGCIRGRVDQELRWNHFHCMDVPSICLSIAKERREEGRLDEATQEVFERTSLDVVLEVRIDTQANIDHPLKTKLAIEVKNSLVCLEGDDWLRLKYAGTLWEA